MKRFAIASFAVTLIAIIANNAMGSGSEMIIKNRAKGVRDQNNAQQGVAPAAPGAPAAGATTPAPPQGISAAQQSLLEHVQTDFTAVKAGTTMTADQKNHLVDDLALLGKGSVKPSKQALTKLASDLGAAFAEKALPAAQMSQLVKDINIVANCGFLTAAKSQTFVAEAQTILKNAGVSAPVVTNVGTDLKAVVTEIQKSKPALYQ